MNEPKIYRFVDAVRNPENPCVEEFVLASEWFALRDEVHRMLQDPHAVHYQMLRGLIARISMIDCAHLHGAAMVERWHQFCEWEKERESV